MRKMKRRKPKDKATLVKHAQKRFYERFNVDMSEDDIYTMSNLIREGRCEFIEKQSNRISLFYVNYNDKKYEVVYDKSRKSIVTVLPEDE